MLAKTRVIFWQLVGVLMVAFALRFWGLAQVPHGLTWDEAAIGYNGYGVITTRRDEWLKRLPISFQSFGDYKAPLAIYLNGLFTTLLGLSPYVIRLPFALAGVLAIAAFYWLLQEMQLIFNGKPANTYLSVAGAAGLAISSWHIHFSRVGFESGLALLLVILALALTFKALNTRLWLWWCLAAVFAVASLYAYHSAKIVMPLLLLVVVWLTSWKRFVTKPAILALGVGVVMLLPMIYDMVTAAGLTRAGTLVFSKQYPWWQLWQVIWTNWQKQLSPDALFFGWTDSLRHGTGKYGLLYVLDMVPLVWLAVRVLTRGLGKSLQPLRQIPALVLMVSWVVIGLLPAVLSEQSPHPNRALLALPGFIGLIIYGWWDVLEFFHQKIASYFIVGLLYVISLVVFLNYYFFTYARTSAQSFGDGAYEAALLAVQIEREGYQGVKPEKILFTSDYGQPYIFVLLAKKISPIWYQGGALAKYEFTNTITTGDLARANTLIIASRDDDIPLDWANQIILGSDQQVAFKVYYPKAQP